MKLFVWEDVLTDYTSGMIVALAPDMETAFQLARDSAVPYAVRDMGSKAPEIFELGPIELSAAGVQPRIWLVCGGG